MSHDRLHETAYPYLTPDPQQKELTERFSPTPEEKAFAAQRVRQSTAKIGFLIHLKVFQRLGYFVPLADVPRRVKAHIAAHCGLTKCPSDKDFNAYDRSGNKRKHLDILREHLQVRVFDAPGRQWLAEVAERAAETKNEHIDIINVLLEYLVRDRYELPAFSTVQKIAVQARNLVHDRYFQTITQSLNVVTRQLIDDLFRVPGDLLLSGWQALKREPRKPSHREVRHYLQHVNHLSHLVQKLPAVALPVSKLKFFRSLAQAYDAAEMRELKPALRYALAVIYVRSQYSKTLDDTGDMLTRLINSLQKSAQNTLLAYQTQNQKRADALIGKLRDVLVAYDEEATEKERLSHIQQVLPTDVKPLIADCEEHLAYAGNNFIPFLLKPYNNQRSLLFSCLDMIELISTSSDKTTDHLLIQLKLLRHVRHEWLDPERLELDPKTDFGWLSANWKRSVLQKNGDVHRIHRKFFELAVFDHLRTELNAGDLSIRHSSTYDDFREQFVDDETVERELPAFLEEVGLPPNVKSICKELKRDLIRRANDVDRNFPLNPHFDIRSGKLHLFQPKSKPLSSAIQRLDEAMTERLPSTNIVDVLTDTETWLDLHKLFGPIMGSKSRLDDPRMRFITTLFCYGCNLGPSQTEKAVKGINRRQVSWLNLKNVTEDRLDRAIEKVINKYNEFELPKYWGTGAHASVDGTMWDLYEQNMMSQYHIRYGGYGGIGYYMVSDTYIALMSHFIPCGAYEAHYLLDGFFANKSDIQPDTIHGDTHSKNYPVFGLSYLLGINLMPRIRDIHDLIFFRPEKGTRYTHIDPLFGDAIDWVLIEKYLPDMLRVAISIKLGTITPSTILRRLGVASSKNKLYYAFRELGKVIRTMFLLKYINDVELRRFINAATTKSEEFNGFAKWAFFGGQGEIAENIQHEQRKVVKYNHLVANMVILHNMQNMSQVLRDLKADGFEIDAELLGGLAPYRTGHINRFGTYVVDLNRKVAPLDADLRILLE